MNDTAAQIVEVAHLAHADAPPQLLSRQQDTPSDATPVGKLRPLIDADALGATAPPARVTRSASTWILDGGTPTSGVVCAAGLYGDRLRIGHGFGGGWMPFGPERTITRAEGNVLFELDGKPALQLYRDYLGDYADGLPATAFFFPLAMRASRSDEQDGVIRTVLALDEANQSITFAGDMPQGGLARLMRADVERLIEGAAEAASHAATAAVEQAPTLAITVSCVGRRLVLGERTEEEIEATLDACPDGTQQVGFYSYGELSPVASGPCRLHNQTMALTTVAERVVRTLGEPIRLGDRSIVVSGSLGLALSTPSSQERPETLLRKADLAMYQAKGDGKARWAAASSAWSTSRSCRWWMAAWPKSRHCSAGTTRTGG